MPEAAELPWGAPWRLGASGDNHPPCLPARGERFGPPRLALTGPGPAQPRSRRRGNGRATQRLLPGFPGAGPLRLTPAHRRHRPRCVRCPVPEARGGRLELPGGSAAGPWRRGTSTGLTAAAAAPRCPTPPSCGTSSRGEAAAPPGVLGGAGGVACRPNG